jgi:hypothetical protein
MNERNDEEITVSATVARGGAAGRFSLDKNRNAKQSVFVGAVPKGA